MTQLPLLQDVPLETTHLSLATLVIPPLEGEFLYSYNPSAHPQLACGHLIEVQFGRRAVHGFVLSTNSDREKQALSEMQKKGITLKAIADTSKLFQAFSHEHLEFLDWVAKYYAEPLSKILDIAVPTPALAKSDPLISLVTPLPDIRRGPAQQRVLDYLASQSSRIPASSIRQACEVSSSLLRSLEEKGFISSDYSNHITSQSVVNIASLNRIDLLSPEQKGATRRILPSISQRRYESTLLHGVTGSGKTEVYLELIIEALKNDQSALIIVPEIALTPQLVDRFESRLKQKVAVLHSSLRPHQRWSHWAGALSGDTRVVIGARSAIFAPMKNLGVIIVDEEHDGSFKQGEGIRYNARDLAMVRAKLTPCPVVLGSATPSLETFHHARNNKHTLLTLRERFFTSRPLAFDIVDLNLLKPWEMPSKNVSPKLLKALQHTLQSGEQAFILYNRRGFASYLQCSSCEAVVGCPHCSVTLTYHRENNSLLCHFCGFSTPPPIACSTCGAKDSAGQQATDSEPLFKLRGAGTERVHEELASLLPSARIAKLDRDAVRSIDDYIQVLSKVRSREIDILVGTQMIAKGHDLPDVTLVGIVDCDVGLHVPDFRAAERAFQLLTQVAGRAGRREKQGCVILQTRVPHHPSLQMTVTSNFNGFAEQELHMRQALGYPPFVKLLRVIVGAESKDAAKQIAHMLSLKAAAPCQALEISMLGPAPAPIEKVRSFWRYHLLFKSQSAAKLQNLMLRLKRDNESDKGVRIVFDLDPQDML